MLSRANFQRCQRHDDPPAERPRDIDVDFAELTEADRPRKDGAVLNVVKGEVGEGRHDRELDEALAGLSEAVEGKDVL